MQLPAKVSLAVAGLAAAAALVLLYPSGDPSQAARATKAASRDEAIQEPSRVEAPVDRVAVDGRISVLDASNGHPVAGAWFRTVGTPSPTVLTEDVRLAGVQTVLAVDGSVRIGQLTGGKAWLVGAAGYEAQYCAELLGGEVLQMRPASSLRVVVRHEDRDPAAGAMVWLYPSGAKSRFHAGEFPGTGIGDPRSDVPTWTGTTDGNGLLELDTLPAGSYRAWVAHPEGYCGGALGSGEGDFTVPGVLQVDLAEFFAVVFAAPPGRKILQHSWTRPATLDWDPGIVRNRHVAMANLQSKFPGTVAFVGRPVGGRRGPEAMVAVKAMLDGSVAAAATWPLLPIRTIEAPVFMELQEQVLYRSVTAQVVDRAGQLREMKLRIRELGPRTVWAPIVECQSGEAVMLPPGRYAIEPDLMLGSVPWDGEGQVQLTAASPAEQTVVLRLAAELCVVRLTPKLEGRALGPMHFSIVAGDSSFGVSNWMPARGPIEVLLPPGQATVRMQAPHYDMEPVEFAVPVGAPRVELSLAVLAK